MEIMFLLVWVVLGGLVGHAIGAQRGRTDGFLVGALLGCIGWVLLLIGPDNRRKCPACKGAIPEGASKCMHCGSDLAAPIIEKHPIISFHCPICQIALAASGEQAGQRMKCISCEKWVAIPT